MPTVADKFTRTPRGEPVHEIAELFPEQGSWSERQYLALHTNRLVEFDNGMIEVLPVPSKTHQLIVLFLYEVLKAAIAGRGRVLVAPYPLRIPTGKYREPDVLYLTPDQNTRAQDKFTDIAELVIEVVSPDDPERDYLAKRRDYAAAGVPEYWIVDRAQGLVIVLHLSNGQYVEHGRYGAGQRAQSHRLGGFSVAVDEIWAQGHP